MAFFACGTRDRRYPVPARPRLTAEARPVMRVAETVSQKSCAKWDAVSACGPVGKLHPTSATNSGMHFPPRSLTGNSIPFQRQIPGRIFRNLIHPESPSIRKALPTLNTSSERMRACCPEQPRHRGDGKSRPKRLQRLCPQVSRKKPRELRGFPHLYCFARRTANGEATPPARPFWRLQPCCPDLPWWGDPLRRPSYRAAS